MSSKSQKNSATTDKGRTSLLGALSLSSKITIWYALFLTLMLAFLSTFVYLFTAQWETNELHNSLESTSLVMADDISQFKSYQNGIFYITYSQEGLIIKGALPDGFPKQSILSPHKVSAITVNDVTYYYYDTPVHAGDFSGWLRSIASVRNISTRASNMILSLLIGAFITLILGIIGGYILVKYALKPLRVISQTATSISQNKDLSQRLPEIHSGKDELYDLTQTLNKMLSTLENASIREKQFSSDISHELRTPIAVIQAESDFGRKHIKTIEEAHDSFTNIFKQSRFMSELITQLLELARIDQSEELPKERIDLSKLLHDLSHDYDLICTNNKIDFTSHIAPNLIIEGHHTSLHRAIANFLDNAIKFTHTKISLVAYINADHQVCVSVIDDGAGIQEENLTKIWNRLYQTESSRSHNKNKGVGLGLYFVKRIADLHNGTVTVNSEANTRTEFSIILPMHSPHTQEDVQSTEHSEANEANKTNEADPNANNYQMDFIGLTQVLEHHANQKGRKK